MTRRMTDERPSFAGYPKPPPGAPNVVLIVLDDVGFAQLGCFGSPIETPNIDRLAAEGLRYNRFHVTSICSATRAALLTGRNHHAVGVGMTMETPLGFPGYTGRIPPTAALLPRTLKDNGYNTFAVGKWHLVPRGEYSAAGPTTRWPLGQHMGFERFYGFLGAETNQWAPELCRDNTYLDAPKTPDEGYHLTEDLVDQATRMLQDQRQAAPGKPFFLYFATGAAHAPHHVPAQWMQRYRGRFDAGWEAYRSDAFERQLAGGVVPAGTRLTPRPAWVPAWDSLGGDERRLFARYMEAFAGFMSHADAQIGRLLDFLDKRGDLDGSIVVLLSDNGASAEGTINGTINESTAWFGSGATVAAALERIDDIGTPRAFNHYPWGWAWAGNTPLQLWKRYSWLGGVRTPLVVRWPGHLSGPGDIRQQFCHAIDMSPTLLDVVGIEAPAVVDGITQQPVDGASIAATFSSPEAPSPRGTQYFEMHGSRAVYHDGWKATTDYVSPVFNERAFLPGSSDFDTDRWCLFDLTRDFAEADDRADEQPERAAELERLWWEEAERNQVLPLFDGPRSLAAMHPGEYPPPADATYTPGGGPIYEGALPPIIGGFAAVAEVRDASSGVIFALGDANDGFALYLLDGIPTATVVTAEATHRLAARSPLGGGDHTVGLTFAPPRLALVVDGAEVAGTELRGVMIFPAVATAGGGMLVGRDRGLAVSDDYRPPFPFQGELRRVRFTSGAPGASRPAEEMIEWALRAD